MKKIFIAVLLLCFALSGVAFADKAVVVSQIAPILSSPVGFSGVERVDEVLCGMIVEVINDDDPNYFLVETPYGLVGFIHAADLNVNEAAATDWAGRINRRVSFPHADVHTNNGSGGNPSQGSNGRMLGWLPKGALIQVTGSASSSYYPISMPPGVIFTNGPKESPGANTVNRFIRADGDGNTKPSAYQARFRPTRLVNQTRTDAQFRDDIVADALSYCGYIDTMKNIENADKRTLGTVQTPWRKGGKTHQGMDASGLVHMVYLLNDKLIPRDVTPGFTGALRFVINPDKKDLGDVLCWNAADGKGIYIGNDQFVYASYADKKVRIGKIGVDLQASEITTWGSVFFKEIISTSPFAKVEKLDDNVYKLTITIIVEYEDGETDIIEKTFSININESGYFKVGDYDVYTRVTDGVLDYAEFEPRKYTVTYRNFFNGPAGVIIATEGDKITLPGLAEFADTNKWGLEWVFPMEFTGNWLEWYDGNWIPFTGAVNNVVTVRRDITIIPEAKEPVYFNVTYWNRFNSTTGYTIKVKEGAKFKLETEFPSYMWGGLEYGTMYTGEWVWSPAEGHGGTWYPLQVVDGYATITRNVFLKPLVGPSTLPEPSTYTITYWNRFNGTTGITHTVAAGSKFKLETDFSYFMWGGMTGFTGKWLWSPGEGAGGVWYPLDVVDGYATITRSVLLKPLI